MISNSLYNASYNSNLPYNVKHCDINYPIYAKLYKKSYN